MAQVANPNPQSRVAGRFVASNYAWSTTVSVFPSGTGSKTFTVYSAAFTLADGRTIFPYATNSYITVGNESVLPTALSAGCNVVTVAPSSCQITATFTYAHVSGEPVTSSSFGLQSALNDASTSGGGIVVVDSAWKALGGTSTIEAAATIPANVAIEDTISGTNTAILTASAAAPGVVRAVVGQITTGASYANGSNSLAGVRGLVTVPTAATASTGYLYGTQGKLVVAGTVNGSTWDAGLLGQTDISAATLTAASHVTPIWSDAGAN
jgi:hypothetical protein